ncbi:beta-ACP synthase [Amycolatopsis keratiniphila subsp. keratiniphila]|uniref:Beta-ACP synthase n=1 Tax=Amycolatopsis keratiniphila subsp. keratiniphila TaxID=227715 RepID=A0A1W2M2Y4_9PSEU|nr:beta-ACP synthase [Amycolatopsis keratiniphila subsp. keratiniphila]
MDRNVAITGLSVLAPGSTCTETFWDMITSGLTATRRITAFDPSPFRSHVAAECDFDPEAHGLTARDQRRMDRAAQFAVVCARQAVADSGLDGDNSAPDRLGVAIGSAVGCSAGLEEEYVVLSDVGKDWLVDQSYQSRQTFEYFSPSSIAREVAGEVGAQGPVAVISNGCTSGIDSVGYAYQLIAEGSADVVITGATEAPITPVALASLDAILATTPRKTDFEQASRPFDLDRNGFALAEGAAVLVLESLEHARRRGAEVYALISGYATRSNAYHMTGLPAGGEDMAIAIRAAMRQAGLGPDDIDYINAHGSGTKQNDRHETSAFKKSLGPRAYEIPVSSIKSMIGHSLGAIGSIEIATCALAMRDGIVPPTANLHTPDPDCDLDYVPLVAREQRVDVALTVGSGFGGFQSAMLLGKPQGGTR